MKNTKYNIILLIVLMGLSFDSCEILEPENSNTFNIEDVESFVTYAEGVLLSAYNNIPRSHTNFSLSYACDDAVTNDQGHSVKTTVDGGWTSNTNPFDTWNNSYESILYINTFLEEMSDVEWWWKDKTTNAFYAQRLRGEAYGLRAVYYFNLLQAHAGMGTNGEMLGVPIVDHVLDANNPDDYEIPRSTFNQLVQFILTDCDSAISNLPDRYENSGTYTYDEAMGMQYTNRINGLAVRLIKAKTLLYAASPAYSDGTYTYQRAAEAAAAIMNLNDGLGNVNFANHNHLQFYNNDNVVGDKNLHPEVFWYSAKSTSNSWEEDNYLPSLYGEGRTDPTQELVNAFPMLDGTPVTNAKINSSDPYSGRDPRLSLNILYNGATINIGNIININTQAGSQDAVGSSDPNTTLTGYYLRKFMNVANVNLDPSVNSEGAAERPTRYRPIPSRSSPISTNGIESGHRSLEKRRSHPNGIRWSHGGYRFSQSNDRGLTVVTQSIA